MGSDKKIWEAPVDQAAFNEEVAGQVANLRRAFDEGRTKPLQHRVDQLKAMQRMLKVEKERIQEALAEDLKKSHFESYNMEINPVEHEIQHQLDHVAEWMEPEYQWMDPLAHLVVSMTGHGRAALYSDPLGVCLIIGAWNYPLHLTLLPVVGAIAAGNAVMIKTPSPKYSPATAALIADIIPKYLDPSCVMVVEGGREGTEAVLQPRFDHIFFTGGSYVGKMVAKAAAKHLTPTVLELGGKSPCIVDKSADLGVVARRMMWGKFTNAGQTCVAADHCYVHQSVAGRFVEECKKALLEFYGEDASTSPDLARIINTRAWETLVAVVEDGKPYAVCGGTYGSSKDLYIAPTLLDYGSNKQAWQSSKAMAEEIFGPILPIRHFDDEDDVVAEINSREKPLAMYIFANDSRFSEKFLTQCTSGHAVVNDILLQFCAPIPFGGVGNSGMGSYHGKWSFKTFSHEKGVLKRHVYAEIPARFPPYDRQWKQLLVGTLTAPFSHKYLPWIKLLLLAIVLRATRLGTMLAPYVKSALMFVASLL